MCSLVNTPEPKSIVLISPGKVAILSIWKSELGLVLEGKYPRAFQEVFRETQQRLQSVFRMKLVELPAKEKRQTIQQRRSSPQQM